MRKFLRGLLYVVLHIFLPVLLVSAAITLMTDD